MWMKHVLDGSSGFVYRHFCLAPEVTVVRFIPATTTMLCPFAFSIYFLASKASHLPRQFKLYFLRGFPSLHLSWGRFLFLTALNAPLNKQHILPSGQTCPCVHNCILTHLMHPCLLCQISGVCLASTQGHKAWHQEMREWWGPIEVGSSES